MLGAAQIVSLTAYNQRGKTAKGGDSKQLFKDHSQKVKQKMKWKQKPTFQPKGLLEYSVVRDGASLDANSTCGHLPCTHKFGENLQREVLPWVLWRHEQQRTALQLQD